MNHPRPIVIGHRGASGYRPEHTLASYQLAIDLGADFIEPDLVSTRDGQLVARHENEISGTTDVAQRAEFAARKTSKTIDGVALTGWFTEDFTLAELKTLRARERLPALRGVNTAFDGAFAIPTFEEVLALARAQKRTVGVYPETKHPRYFQSIGLPLERPLLRALAAAGHRERADPIFIQSFEIGNLKQLRAQTNLRLIQLIDTAGSPADASETTYASMVTSSGLSRVASYADGVGVHKDLIVPRGADQTLLAPSTLIRDAHAQNLAVHAWTFRAENHFLPANFRVTGEPAARGDLHEELKLFFSLGVDGVFADHPDVAVATRAGLYP